MKMLVLLLISALSASSFAEGKKVAVVKILRGEVSAVTTGKMNKLKVEDWVEDGAVVKTADKSFVKLIFIDKSQMNVGPNSEMKIEKFSGNDSGVIDLVKGKIRSQVTKDYLQMKDQDKSKLFIKTPNAVMGVRGTDFMISTNGKNTSAVLFEGSVVFNKIDSSSIESTEGLEDIVNQGVRMHPGEFSVVDQHRALPTIPSRLNIQQRETLEKNPDFESQAANKNDEVKKSVVPNGLSGHAVSNDSSVLKSEVIPVGSATASPRTGKLEDANGYIKGDAVKPANGSFLHIESGIIIPPGNDSILDPNTNSYIPGPSSGKVSADGSYIPPKNVVISNDGKISVTTIGPSGQKKVVVTAPPSVVKIDAPKVGETLTPVLAPPADPFAIPGASPVAAPAPTGGVSDVGQAVQQFSGTRPRTIRVENK